MQRISQGDARAYRQLVDQYLGVIVTYAFRLLKNQAEAEEVAQETFLRAWQNAASYKPQARVTTWLHRIAHNRAIDLLRQQSTRGAAASLDEERDAAPASQNPGRLLERKHTAERVQTALDALPERQKIALVLSHEQGLSNPEIAEVLSLSVDAVESLLARGRRQLRQLLSPPSGGPT